jgi:undecaprenyl-diphosphatase
MNKKWTILILLSLLSVFCYAQNWDIEYLKEVNLNRNRSFDSLFVLITDVSAPVAYSIPVILLIVSIVKQRELLRQKSYFLIFTTLAMLLIATITKHIVNRTRPFITYPIIQKVGTGGSPSFPSGHTCDAFTLAMTLSLAFPKWYVILPSFLWAILVGYSRMDLGVHYPSDVLAALVMAMIGSLISWYFFRKKFKTASHTQHTSN